MEPSSLVQVRYDLFALLREARREDSFIPLHDLAELVVEALGTEASLLAHHILLYESRPAAAKGRA